MDIAATLRMVAALGLILGLLAAALWAVRRFDLRLPGRATGQARLQVVERIALDPKRTLLLVRRDDREHLLLLDPARPIIAERSIRVAGDAAAPDAAPAHPGSFASLLVPPAARPRRGRRAGGGHAKDDACVAG